MTKSKNLIITNKTILYTRLESVAESKQGKLLSSEYKTAKTKYKFECKEHHKFELTADKVTGRGDWCPYCAGRYGDFENEYKNIIENIHHGTMLSHYKNNTTKIKCQCENGHINYIAPGNLKAGKWCSKCNQSHGEVAIKKWLEDNNIIFIEQYSFDNLIDESNLLFDFAIFNKNNKLECLLEFDGEQHYRPMRFRNKQKCLSKFNKTKLHDNMKNEYCKKNNIKLIRISCFDVDYRRLKNLHNDIDDILFDELFYLL